MHVDNFFFGLQAAFSSTIDTLRIATSYPLPIGFLMGFFAASVVHTLLTADRISHVPSMVLHDPSVSFQKMYPPSADGSFQYSYATYSRNVERLKMGFYATGVLVISFLMIVTLVLN